MKRRLMIARALVHEPKLLILDEPTAGVDIEMRRSMWDFLQRDQRRGTTIILTTHYLEEAESLCRNIAIIDQGEIIENTSMKELLRRLDRETFVLDVSATCPLISRSRAISCAGRCHTLEVTVDRRGAERVVRATVGEGYHVSSMRNKANRLEELFVALVHRNSRGSGMTRHELMAFLTILVKEVRASCASGRRPCYRQRSRWRCIS